MQIDNKKKELLLEFLDKNVFDPVLEAVPEQYSSERDRKMLKIVQQNVKNEKDLFHQFPFTAQEIRNQYFRELYFEARGRNGRELEDLELPRFVQLREQFIDLCKNLQLDS
jgi:hypothetical protein